MRVGWVTDIHLEFVDEPDRFRFYETLREAQLDTLLIGGDIGVSWNVSFFLGEIENALTPTSIYFVLGNHDFYHSSIAAVKREAARMSASSPRVKWLSSAGVVKLSETTALVGHDSWADAQYGDFLGSDVLLNDYLLIEELCVRDQLNRTGTYNKERLQHKLRELGHDAAQYIRTTLHSALETHANAIVLTHAPPFRESCWHEGRISNDEYLPHFTCYAVGEAIREVIQRHPRREVTVLCGHTHGSGFAQIEEGIEVWSGGAEYGRPVLQRVFDV